MQPHRPVAVSRCEAEKPDHRHRPLLSTRHERPRACRTAKKRDELAPSHVPPVKGHAFCKG